MFVIIAGGGRTGSQLAQVLLASEHQVIVIEHRRALLTRLHRELPTEAVYEGNATDPAVLEQVGIRKANVIAACTSDDPANLALCFLARKLFGVPRTIARVNNPRNAWLFDETFHVDSALNQANVEFRRGSSGGGNQLRQPYLKRLMPDKEYEKYQNVEHIHFYGYYIGNYPSLEKEKILQLCELLNNIK